MSSSSKMYIAVLDEFPDFMCPTLVAHAVLGYHFYNAIEWSAACGYNPTEYELLYDEWSKRSFKKCVVRVNQKEFDKITLLPNVGLFHENSTLGGKKACAVIVVDKDIPNVLNFARLWRPKETPNEQTI